MDGVKVGEGRVDVVDVGGHRIECRMIAATAAGMPVMVFLHDRNGCASLWQDFPDRLATATGCSVFLYSRLGHGQSDADDTAIAASGGFAAGAGEPGDAGEEGNAGAVRIRREALLWLPRVLDRLAISEPALLGHGEGASIALEFTALSQRPIAALVLEALHEVTDEVSAGLEMVTCPVLLVQGERDEQAGPGHAEALTRAIGGSVEQVRLVASGGTPHQDQPDVVLATIARFLRERVPPSRGAAAGRAIRTPGRTMIGQNGGSFADEFKTSAVGGSPAAPASGPRFERVRKPSRPGGPPRRPLDGPLPRR